MKVSEKSSGSIQYKKLEKKSKFIKKKKDEKIASPNFNKEKISEELSNTKTQKNVPGNSNKKVFNKPLNKTNNKFNETKSWSKQGQEDEKTDWNKFKKEKKELKLKRKEGRYKDLNSLVNEAKKIYEKLKCRKTEKKNELSEKLFIMLKKAECLDKFVLAHDTSRIIQCLLKYSSPQIREELSLALLPVSINMMQSRYANFCIVRMLKYGSNLTKSKLIESLYGSVIKLCSHNIAGKIMDVLYFDKASKSQKICLRQEFYSDLLTKSKDQNVEHLKDTYSAVQNSKDFVLESVKNKLTHLVNKNAMDNSLVHEILLEYINECDGKSKEDCDEFLKMCIPIIPHLITTKCGTKAAIYIFWLSQTKERRAIIKNIKEHLFKIFTHEHGHQLILAIVNSLDDTKALKKTIFDPLIADFAELIKNQYGRKVIYWFILPEDKDIFAPELLKFLEDGLKNSKKDKELRRKEIFDQIEETLCEKIKEDPSIWMFNGNIGLLTSAFLKQISSEKSSEIFNVLAKEITSLIWKTENSETELGIEDSGMHHVFKKILKNDRIKLEKREPTFAEHVLSVIKPETVELWISKNRGCFLLILLFEALNQENQKKFKEILKLHLETLESLSFTGAEILLKKLKM